MRRLWIPALGLMALMGAFSSPARAVDEVFQKTYPLAPEGILELQNVNGSVQITGWDRDAVEVRAVKRTQRDAAELDRVQISVSPTMGRVAIETRYPADEGVEVFVEYTIRVPRHAQLREVNTVNGTVRVSGVDSSGNLRSVNGNVELLDSSGAFSARTTNGDLRLELRNLDSAGPFSAETVNGSILLALGPGAGASLEVRTMNGDFRSDLPVSVLGASGSREFRGRLGRGGNTLALHTVNGTIRIVALTPTA